MKRFFTLMIFSLLFFGVYAQNAGDFDTTFGTGGIVLTPIGTASGMAYDLVVQPDGKIILAGKASIGTSKFAMVRYNANGTIDEMFGTNGIVTLKETNNKIIGNLQENRKNLKKENQWIVDTMILDLKNGEDNNFGKNLICVLEM